MSNVKPRLWNPKPHKAVDWNQKAIAKVLAKYPLTAGIKYDGFRCLVTRIDGSVRITTREGIELVSLSRWRPVFADILDQFWDQVLDCEVYIPGMPFEDASGIFRREEPIADELAHRVRFCVFDKVSYDVMLGKAPDTMPQCDRLMALGRLISVDPSNQIHLEPRWPVKSLADIEQLYKAIRLKKMEGLILKDPLLPYRNGKVNGWWKVKPGCGAEFAPGFEADGVVVGYVWGDAEKSNAGKIVGFRVRLEDGTEVNATGLTQHQMLTYTEHYHQRGEPEQFLQKHCRVSGMERTKDGSIRHPHFDGFRDVGGTKA